MKKPDYWLNQYMVLQLVNWDKKPDRNHRPIVYCDKPIEDERLKALWLESEGKPKKFARLIEAEHSIKHWEIEE